MGQEITKEWLILCEGKADKAFFRELIKKRGLPDFDVWFPLRKNDDSGGWTKFGYWLNEIKTNEGFIRNTKAILVVADNDDDPATRFTEIQAQIRDGIGYGVPKTPLQATTSAGDLPQIVIMMVPLDGNPGNLETILIPAAYSKWPDLQTPLDEYLGQSPAREWEDRKKAKMRMQCILAATCKQDPNTPVSLLWTRPEDYHIPVECTCFDEIAAVLRNFAELLK